MNKLILKSNDVIEIEDYASLLNIETMVDSYSDLDGLYAKLSDDNLSDVRFTTSDDVQYGEYTNMTLNNKELRIVDNDTYLKVSFGIRHKTEVEMKEAETYVAISYLSDEQALAVKDLHKDWNDDPIGYSYKTTNPMDARRKSNGGLWKLNKDHNKQSDWYPGSDPTLWTQIVEGHDGTLEDPIPVPDSVTTSGFEYEYGKYYSEGEDVYLCKRGGVGDPESMYGQIEKLYFMPSALVGQYFEKVDAVSESVFENEINSETNKEAE